MTPSPGTALPPEETLYEGRPAVVPGLGALLIVILTVGLWYLFLWVQAQGLSYKVTTRRVLERGLFSAPRTGRRIPHQRLRRRTPFGQRLLGTETYSCSPQIDHTGGRAPARTDVVALYGAQGRRGGRAARRGAHRRQRMSSAREQRE